MIKDSGNRREFSTGAVRDIDETKGRCDLLPFDVLASYYDYVGLPVVGSIFSNLYYFKQDGNIDLLNDAIVELFNPAFENKPFENLSTMFLELSRHFKDGAEKYGEYNWQKGIPVHCYIDSAVRHLLKHLRGDTDERHDRAFVWNVVCCIWTMKHKPELDDFTDNGKKENAKTVQEK